MAAAYLRLKGLNRHRKRLADGTPKTYWYAWKGGPRLPGAPGSSEFVAAYNAAVAAKVKPAEGVIKGLIARYVDSAEFGRLAPRTRLDYLKQLGAIERDFGDFPLAALKERRSRAIVFDWRDDRARRSLRQADYGMVVFARLLSWGHNRGLVDSNPLQRIERVYAGSRAEKVWSDEQVAAFMATAAPRLRLALMLALWTGQRQGDLLRLPWSAYDGHAIRLQQGKTGRRVVVPVAAALRQMLEATPRKATVILTQRDGRAWTTAGFQTSWKKAARRAGIDDVRFNDLRGTAVTRLALAGCTEAEIATITGHTLRDVASILDQHYLARDPRLAESAIAKLEASTKGGRTFPTKRPTDTNDD